MSHFHDLSHLFSIVFTFSHILLIVSLPTVTLLIPYSFHLSLFYPSYLVSFIFCFSLLQWDIFYNPSMFPYCSSDFHRLPALLCVLLLVWVGSSYLHILSLNINRCRGEGFVVSSNKFFISSFTWKKKGKIKIRHLSPQSIASLPFFLLSYFLTILTFRSVLWVLHKRKYKLSHRLCFDRTVWVSTAHRPNSLSTYWLLVLRNFCTECLKNFRAHNTVWHNFLGYFNLWYVINLRLRSLHRSMILCF